MPLFRKKQDDSVLVERFRGLLSLGSELLSPRSASSDVLRETRKKSEESVIASYINRYDFGSYYIDFVYSPLPGELTAAPSTLEARIHLDKTEPLFFFLPYDILPYINPGDFICRHFPYVESEERMERCYRALADSLLPYLSSFAAISSDSALTERAYNDLKSELNRIFGLDLFAPSGNGSDYDEAMVALRFAHAVKWKSAVYSSVDYNDFLIGNRARVMQIPARYKILPDYMRHVASATAASTAEATLDGQAPAEPAPLYTGPAEASSLSAMQEQMRKNNSLPLLILSCILCLPLFTLLYGLLYGTIAHVVSTKAVFFTGATLGGLTGIFSYVILSAVVSSIGASRLLLKLIAPKRYRAYKPYLRLLRKAPNRPLMGRLKKGVYILSVLLVTLTACRGVFFQSDAILDRSGFFPFGGENYGYRDILSVTEYRRSSGSFYYVMEFEGGGKLNLSSVMGPYDCERVADKLRPVLEEHGITIDRDENEKKAG